MRAEDPDLRSSPIRPPTLIASVQRALRLMEAASRHNSGAPAKVLAWEAGLRLGTAYHLIRTLTYEGYLKRLDDGSYVLTAQISMLEKGSRQQAALARARTALAALRDQARAASYLCIYEQGEIKLRAIVDNKAQPRVDFWAGLDDTAHATALGKSILAALGPEARRDYIARHRLAELTERTITDSAGLLRLLARDELTQISVDRGEYTTGIGCLATPIGDQGLVGSIAISLSVDRLHEVDRLSALLRGAAGQVTRAYLLTI